MYLFWQEYQQISHNKAFNGILNLSKYQMSKHMMIMINFDQQGFQVLDKV